MRKLFLNLFLIAAAVFSGAAYAQSADDMNVEKLSAKLAATPSTDWWKIADLNVCLQLAKYPPASFDALKTAVIAGANAVKNFPSDQSRKNFIAGQIAGKGRWWYNGAYIRETYAYAKDCGTQYLLPFFVWYDSRLGLDDEEIYTQTLKVLTECDLSAKRAMLAVENLTKAAASIDEKTVKADLKKLNRLFSPKLLKDKTAWEPVVAMIRTALDTY